MQIKSSKGREEDIRRGDRRGGRGRRWAGEEETTWGVPLVSKAYLQNKNKKKAKLAVKNSRKHTCGTSERATKTIS